MTVSDRQLRNLERGFGVLISLILGLCFLISISNRGIFLRFSEDAKRVAGWCGPAARFDRECLSFWYKTLEDPAVAWNFWYSVLTFSLVVGAAISIHFGKLQREDTRRHFELEQRPWIKVSININPQIQVRGSDMIMRARIELQNIGKSPAFQVTRGWFYLMHPSVDLREFWDSIRRDVDDRMDYMGVTLLPGEMIEREVTIDVPAEQINLSKTNAGLSSGVTVVSFKYRSGFSEKVHESSRMYSVDIGGGIPLHMVAALYRAAAGITILPLGMFEIAS